jgi:hypothetical protein
VHTCVKWIVFALDAAGLWIELKDAQSDGRLALLGARGYAVRSDRFIFSGQLRQQSNSIRRCWEAFESRRQMLLTQRRP